MKTVFEIMTECTEFSYWKHDMLNEEGITLEQHLGQWFDQMSRAEFVECLSDAIEKRLSAPKPSFEDQ